MAGRQVQALPRTLKFVLGGIGATNRSGASLPNYLLFEDAYCGALIDLRLSGHLRPARRGGGVSGRRSVSLD